MISRYSIDRASEIVRSIARYCGTEVAAPTLEAFIIVFIDDNAKFDEQCFRKACEWHLPVEPKVLDIAKMVRSWR